MTITNPSFEDAFGDVVALPDSWYSYTFTYLWDYKYFGAPYATVESMGYGWSSCEDSLEEFGVSDITAKLFGTDLDNYEDFEDQWSNEPVYDEMPTTDDKTFDYAAGTSEDFEEEWPSRHIVLDDRSITIDPLATTLSDADTRTRLNALKATYEAHRVDTDHHTAADTTNTISSPDATDLSSTTTLVNEMWSDCWDHIMDSNSYHYEFGPVEQSRPTRGEYPASTYDDARILLTFTELHMTLHFSWADNSGAGYADELIPLSSWITSDGIRELALDAEFDSSPEVFENFEEEWLDNENSISAFVPATHLSDFDFTTSSGTTDKEDFETKLSVAFPTTSSTAGAERAISHTLPLQVEITGTFAVTAYVETRNKGSATWVQRSTITTVPVTVELDAGYEAVRIYTDTYTSGSPSAELHFLEV